jgi:hypothetical protein
MIAVTNLPNGRARVECDCGFTRTLDNGRNGLGVADAHLESAHPDARGISFRRESA